MASLFLVGLELGFYNLMVVECPCKENPASGWLMTRSHTSFSWLVGWLDGQFALAHSGQSQTGSHCGNLESSRPTNRRSGFIPVMRRWDVGEKKTFEVEAE